MDEFGGLYNISVLWDEIYLTTDANVVKVSSYIELCRESTDIFARLSSQLNSRTSRKVHIPEYQCSISMH